MNVLTLLYHGTVRDIARERVARMHRTRLLTGRGRGDRRVRRWVGRQLVRTGIWLANDPTMRPVRAR